MHPPHHHGDGPGPTQCDHERDDYADVQRTKGGGVMNLSDADVSALNQRTDRELAQWWCELNSHEWPEGLPNPEPRIPGMPVALTRSWAIMEAIKGRVGDRLCSRVWNHDMTDEEHADFWAGVFEGNAAARERHELRMAEKHGYDYKPETVEVLS